MSINQNQIKGYLNDNTTLVQDLEKIYENLEDINNKIGSLNFDINIPTIPGNPGKTDIPQEYIGIRQISKLGVHGTPEKPRIVSLPINTKDFRVPKVNVLKYIKGEQDIIKIKNDFTNGESNDFKSDENIIFDGTAHLKTKYNLDYANLINTSRFNESAADIDLRSYKKIEGFEEKNRVLTVKAVPFDRILTPIGDIDLKYADHIDFFKIKAIGDKLKIIASNDSGKTWYTFINHVWKKIKFDNENCKQYGISIDDFNNIPNTKWNEFNINKKIRFAYFFEMDNVNDKLSIDELSLQHDGQGRLMEAKDSEYDVIYVNNSLLQIHIKFSGDIKINY